MDLKEAVIQMIYVCFRHKWNMSVTSGICRSQVEYVGHKWNIGPFGFNLTVVQ